MILSILIPSYNHPDGIDDIMSKIPSDVCDFEIIISDDSTNNYVLQVVNKWIDFGLPIKYIKNNPQLGACKNWNSLIKLATGKFCLILHHDEYFQYRSNLEKIINSLRNNEGYDIFYLGLIILNNGIYRKHLPCYFLKFTIKFAPEYVFRRNVLGPISQLIIKKSIYPEFDCNLNWYIDVDFYYRLFSAPYKLYYLNRIFNISKINKNHSITNLLKNNISSIIASEKKYLKSKYKKNFWLRINKLNLISLLEILIWTILRIILIPFSFIFFTSIK